MDNSKTQNGISTVKMLSNWLPLGPSGIWPSNGSLKVILIALMFIIPVGFILAKIETEVNVPMNEKIPTITLLTSSSDTIVSHAS